MTFPPTSVVMARAAAKVKDGLRKEQKLCGFIGSRLYLFALCFALNPERKRAIPTNEEAVSYGGALKPYVERRDARNTASRSRNIPRTLIVQIPQQGIPTMNSTYGGALKPCREETAFWLTRAALKIYPKTSPLPFRALRGICFLVKPRGFEYLSKNFPVVIPSLARNLLFA
jgi:hypothetical protein